MKQLLFFAFAVALCCGLTACGGDDDNNGGGSLLIGTWSMSGTYYYSYETNGRFPESCILEGDLIYTDTGSYSFNGGVLVHNFDDGRSYTYFIVMLTDSQLVYMDDDGDTRTLTRVGNN